MPPSIVRTAAVLSIVFLVVATAFAGVVGYLAIGMSVSKMEISTGSPACTATAVPTARGAIVLRRDMASIVPVTVRNDTRLSIRLEQLVLPYMGPNGGPAVQVTSWEGQPTPGFDLDAVFDVDRRLEPGATWETEILLEFRPGGCTARGTFSLGIPEIQAAAWGRSVRVNGPTLVFEGTGDSDC